MAQKPSKKSIKKHMTRLVARWRTANDLTWDTVGRPGPVFFDTEPGPDKDAAWAAHHRDIDAQQRLAGYLYRKALKDAPDWLKQDKSLIDKCFNRAFTRDGYAVIGPGILGPGSRVLRHGSWS